MRPQRRLLLALALTATAGAAAQPVVLHEVTTVDPSYQPAVVHGQAPLLGTQAAPIVFETARGIRNPNIGSAGYFGFWTAGDANDFVMSSPWEPDSVDWSNGMWPTGMLFAFRYDAATQSAPQVQRIRNPTGSNSSEFGRALALLKAEQSAPAVLVVGAPFERNLCCTSQNIGAVYLFERASTVDTWVFKRRFLSNLTPSQGARFGTSVAVAPFDGGVRVVASAPVDTALYVIERSSGTGEWVRTARIHHPIWNGQGIGGSVAVTGDLILGSDLAASHPEKPKMRGVGVAYLYERDPTTGTWAKIATWWPPEPAEPPSSIGWGWSFGHAVDLVSTPDGPVAFVGMPFKVNAGFVYVYEPDKTTGEWTVTDSLAASDLEASGGLGYRLAAANTPSGVLVAASRRAATADGVEGAGAVYVFRRDPATGTWEEFAKLSRSDASPYTYFGDQGLDVTDEGVVYVGSVSLSTIQPVSLGAAYVFDLRPLLPVSSENGPGPVSAVTIETIWPNPSSSSASVGYRLGAAGAVVVSVLDLLGREVARVVEREQSAGWHGALIETGGLSPGVYAVRVEAGGSRAVRRLVVAR